MQPTTPIEAELIESYLFDRHCPLLWDDALRIALRYTKQQMLFDKP